MEPLQVPGDRGSQEPEGVRGGNDTAEDGEGGEWRWVSPGWHCWEREDIAQGRQDSNAREGRVTGTKHIFFESKGQSVRREAVR